MLVFSLAPGRNFTKRWVVSPSLGLFSSEKNLESSDSVDDLEMVAYTTKAKVFTDKDKLDKEEGGCMAAKALRTGSTFQVSW